MEGGGRDSSVNFRAVCTAQDAGKAQNYPQALNFRAAFSTSYAEKDITFCVTINIISNSSKMVLHLLGVLFFFFSFSLVRLWINRVFIHHCVRLHPCGKGCGEPGAGGGGLARRYCKRHVDCFTSFFFFFFYSSCL